MNANADDPTLGQLDNGGEVDPAPSAAQNAGAAPSPAEAAASSSARPDVEEVERPPPEQLQPVRTIQLSPGSENETARVVPCSCGENGSRDRPGCVHLQIYRINVDAINLGPGDTDTQRNQNKTFLMWLMDEDHMEDHIMFVMSIMFCISLFMMLTFAWREAEMALAGVWWLWAGLLALLLMVQTCTWVTFALYSLWLYPKAYIRWKAEPHAPLSRLRSPSRRRRRRRRRRQSSTGSLRSSTAATQTQPVLGADRGT